MLNVHFKRHGYAGWVELQGLGKFSDKHGNYIYIEIPNWKGFHSTMHMERVENSHVVENKIYKLGLNPSWDVMEKRIAKFISEPVQLGHFIESYHIPQRENETDRDLINNVDVTDMTTKEVIDSIGINLRDYWNDWHLPENVYVALDHPSDKILDMPFKKLFQIIHWNCSTKGFEQKFFSEVEQI